MWRYRYSLLRFIKTGGGGRTSANQSFVTAEPNVDTTCINKWQLQENNAFRKYEVYAGVSRIKIVIYSFVYKFYHDSRKRVYSKMSTKKNQPDIVKRNNKTTFPITEISDITSLVKTSKVLKKATLPDTCVVKCLYT